MLNNLNARFDNVLVVPEPETSEAALAALG